MSAVICEYRLQARRPGNYFALGVGLSVAYLAWSIPLSPVIWALLALYLGLVLWRLIRNPATGFRLRADRVETVVAGRLKVVPLYQVESFRIRTERFGQALCLLTLRDGQVVAVPCGSRKHADALALGLQRHGIPDA